MLQFVQVFIIYFSLIGFSPVNGICGGHNTTINRHPVQLSLQHGGVHICGAALVKLQWVLTSARCASKNFDLKIRAGSNSTSTGGELYDVEKIFIHPDFDEKTLDSDLALLKLPENVTTNHTFTAWLPRSSDAILEDASVDITGWGYTNSTEESFPDMLQFAQVPAKTLSQCRLKYPEKVVTENMQCGGFDKGDITSCTGDYGGPIIIQGRLAGIQSWGEGCGDVNHPSVFVNVARFVTWINDTVNANE